MSSPTTRPCGFSGSYAAEDVTFLLKPIDLPLTGIHEKEALIQSGQRHYSEMLSPERPASAAYLAVFHQAFARHRKRFARDLLALARTLHEEHGSEITLVSLARAGTPVGVLLTRLLRRRYRREVSHYSVSIIRDRGIDTNALRFILDTRGHAPASLVFLDGWTGKGVIARELQSALQAFKQQSGVQLCPDLCVVADLSGTAGLAATAEDYLIPSSVLNGTISGLISRSVLNRDYIGPQDFHGCLYLDHLAAEDLSRWFADEVESVALVLPDPPPCPTLARERLQGTSQAFLAEMTRRFGVQNPHYIKPGIGEATRVLLRRVPDRLLVRDRDWSDVQHLLVLAAEKNVPVQCEPTLPYHAVALIQQLD